MQVTSNADKPGWSQQLSREILVGNLLINIRATGSAQIIRRTVRQILEQEKWQKTARTVWREEAAFQPGKPVPAHRVK